MLSPTFPCALNSGLGEAVVVCDIPKPHDFVRFHILTVARRGSCGPTRKLILLHTLLLVLCSELEMWRFPQALYLESSDPFLRVSEQDQCLTVENSSDKRLNQLFLFFVVVVVFIQNDRSHDSQVPSKLSRVRAGSCQST